MEHPLLSASRMAQTPKRPTPEDEVFMKSLADFAHRELATDRRSPFASDVVETSTGKLVMRRLNGVRIENDPSSHAEVRVMRAACKKLKTTSLKGHTLYTTCEPCPMCMAMALWAGIDRVVFGSTISDASRHCAQIYVPAKTLQRKSDMDCEVVGPVLRKECVALFEDPRMLSAMALWKKSRGGSRAKPARRASGS